MSSAIQHDTAISGGAQSIETHVKSSWQQAKEYVHGKSQTDPLRTAAIETQTVLSAMLGAHQGSSDEGSLPPSDKAAGGDVRREQVPPASIDGVQFVYRSSGAPHYNEAEVADFLEGVADELYDVLLRNNTAPGGPVGSDGNPLTNLVNHYEGYSANWSTDKLETISCAFTLHPPTSSTAAAEAAATAAAAAVKKKRKSKAEVEATQDEGDETSANYYHVTALGWNATGSSVAVGYGRTDCVGWSKKKGFVSVWNVGTKASSATSTAISGEGVGGAYYNADVVLETDAFVTAVSYHPLVPSVLAIGTYNGEVLLCNLAGGEGEGGVPEVTVLVTADGPSAAQHATVKEPITHLQWLTNTVSAGNPKAASAFVLCSSSQDGKVLFWNPSVGRRIRKLGGDRSGEESCCAAAYEVHNKKRALVGVQSLSFVKSAGVVPSVDNVMVLGVETGEILRTKPGVTSGLPVNDNGCRPLDVDPYESHTGPVHAVDCSPFFRNVFLSCSSDGSVRLYSVLERHALRSLEPPTSGDVAFGTATKSNFLYDAQFSPFRPGVIACVSRNSSLHLYDLEKDGSKPVITLDASSSQATVDGGSSSGIPVLRVAFNPANPRLLATGDIRGVVRIWSLSAELYQPTDLERAAVRRSEGGATKKDEPLDVADAEHNPMRQLLGFAV